MANQRSELILKRYDRFAASGVDLKQHYGGPFLPGASVHFLQRLPDQTCHTLFSLLVWHDLLGLET